LAKIASRIVSYRSLSLPAQSPYRLTLCTTMTTITFHILAVLAKLLLTCKMVPIHLRRFCCDFSIFRGLTLGYWTCQCYLLCRPTRSSATADGPRDALCQSKPCQLLHKCRNKSYNKSTTNRSILEFQLEYYGRPTCSKRVQRRRVDRHSLDAVNKLDRR